MLNYNLCPETIKHKLLKATGGCEFCEYKHIRKVMGYSQSMARERMRKVKYDSGGRYKRFPVEQAAYAIATYKYGDGKKASKVQRKRRMERSSCKGS